MNSTTPKMTPDEYRELLRQVRAEQPVVSEREAWEQYLEIGGLLEALHGPKSCVLTNVELTEDPHRGLALVGRIGYGWFKSGTLKQAELRLPDGESIRVNVVARELLYPAPWKDISDMAAIYIVERLYASIIPEGGELHRLPRRDDSAKS